MEAHHGAPATPTATELLLAVVLGGLALVAARLYVALVWKPRRRRLSLQKQGIGGPPPSVMMGNFPDIKRIQTEAAAAPWKPQDKNGLSHAWPAALFPHLAQWRTNTGQYSCIPWGTYIWGPLLGDGIISSSGSIWAHQRKIIGPELYLDKVKGMVNLMVNSTNLLLRSWESRVNSEGGSVEISIDDDLRSLSADIISRACFGSSYLQGEEIFLKLRELQKVMSKGNIGIPGSRYLPTKDNRKIWKLNKDIRSKILEVVKQRQKASHEKDLLQMILEGAKGCGDSEGLPTTMSQDRFIVDNCKTLYFAGHETTAITASWSLMLLAAHPDWQVRARAEVVGLIGDGVVDYDKLRGMKTVNMIVLETLRLYPPATFVIRSALEDMKFKQILIPKGLEIQFPVAMLHHDPEIWGATASKFNPERFAHGISGACKFVQAYMPFGLGPRVCAGQHFAMVELKVILALILSKFSFYLSPKYRHSPAFRLVTEPGYGVSLIMRKL